jgi:Tfp pilus assembly protein PilX
MVILAGATILSLAAVNTSIMEMRMAGNVEAQGSTFQLGAAAVDYVLSDLSNLPSTGPLNLPVSVTLADSLFTVASGDSVVATATRTEDCAAPPRARSGSSITAFSAFGYEIAAAINKNSSGFGSSSMAQGYVLLGPKC